MAVKVAVAVLSLCYIAIKLYSENRDGELLRQLKLFGTSEILHLVPVFVLLPVNWFFEAIKFRGLVKPIQSISYYQAVKAVLVGITVSIFTPKRIGDFGGRIFVLETKNRVSGIFATLLGSLSQLLVTLIAGVLLLPVFLNRFLSTDKMMPHAHLPVFASLIAVVMLLLVYFNISKVEPALLKIRAFKKHAPYFRFLKSFSTKDMVVFLLISTVRYIVFTYQFYLLLKLFGVDIQYANAIVAISQIYLITSLLPTVALGELGVRGSVAIWVLSSFTAIHTGVIVASMLLWVINLAMPALFGMIYLSRLKY